MTDLEINKELALAIGWPEKDILTNEPYTEEVRVWFELDWLVFDYKDWLTIAPIATHYDAFPTFCDTGVGDWWVAGCHRNGTNAGQGAATPQKAIAMAVIKGAKR